MQITRRRRLAHTASVRQAKRLNNGPAKRAEKVRRDERIIAKLRAMPADGSMAPEVASWVAAKLGKPAAKATPEQIQALLA